MEERKQSDPSRVWAEYKAGAQFKAQLGKKGLYEQNKANERMYVGDQWYGVNCGDDRPLVRYNVIKRIGDYKMAVVGASPITVNYTADGIPNTLELQERTRELKDRVIGEQGINGIGVNTPFCEGPATDSEINVIMSAMSDYFRTTAERLKFDDLKETALRNAYCTGTGILYTWWDDRIRTGLYADISRRTPIKGDIACEVLDIENVYFGDPNLDDVQGQPYILIAQRKSVKELRRDARRNKRPREEIERIAEDGDTEYMAGQRGEDEPLESRKATVLTKMWKEWNEDGSGYTIKAVQVCRGATIRKEWDMGIRLYPVAKFSWERRHSCVYGDSEITYLIPNQIAINRMITASVWAVMTMGMPIMIANGDIVTGDITNDPGQVIKVFGGESDVAGAVRYVNPPNFSPKFDENIESMISQTMTQAGANDAALGNMRPDNTSAIIAVREAATMPLQMVQNRFYSFCEDVARIWAEFWVMMYGNRSLKVQDESGTWYMPFEAKRYRDLVINARIDVGASTLWSESQSIRTLDNLFDRQVIDAVQYLSRLPKGTVPNVAGLIREMQQAAAPAPEAAAVSGAVGQPGAPDAAMPSEQDVVAALSPDLQEVYNSMPQQARTALIKNVLSQTARTPETMPTGTTL